MVVADGGYCYAGDGEGLDSFVLLFRLGVESRRWFFVGGPDREEAKEDGEEDAAEDPGPGGGVGAAFVDH
jgi:hypothetical protein